MDGGEFLKVCTLKNSVVTTDFSLTEAILTSDFCSTSVCALVMINVFEMLCINTFLCLIFPFLVLALCK